jgi:hypothetical protein
MTGKILLILNKWLKSSAELLFILPMVLAVEGYLLWPMHWGLLLIILSALYLLGILCSSIFGDRSKWFYLTLGLILSGIGIFPYIGWSFIGVIAWSFSLLAFYRGHLYWNLTWSDVLRISYLWFGVLLYFISSFFFTASDALKPFLSIFTAGGLIGVALSLWMTNAVSLKNTVKSSNQTFVLPNSIVKHNRAAVVVIISIILVITFFKAIQYVITQILNVVMSGIAAIFLFLSSLLGSETPVESGENASPGLPIPENSGESPWWNDLLFQIGRYAAFILLGVLVLLLLRKFIKLAYRQILKFLDFLKSRNSFTRNETGYVEEETKIISWKGLGKIYTDRLQEWLADMFKKEPKWKDLQTNKERIRYLYRHWLLERIAAGYTIKSNLTPHETEKDVRQWRSQSEDEAEMAAAYNEARYSNHDISDETVTRIKKVERK